MATTSEHELAELKRELTELAKQAERLAGRADGWLIRYDKSDPLPPPERRELRHVFGFQLVRRKRAWRYVMATTYMW